MNLPAIRILIADDDVASQDLLSHQLKGEGFKLDIHDCAENLLVALNDNPDSYDVILLDHNMPGGMSGIECLRSIKRSEHHRHLPVIIQTCEDDTTIITEALSAGAYYFLEKTTERKLLQAVVFSAMENKIRFQEVEKERSALKTGLRFVEEAHFRIRTLDDMNSLTALLVTAYPDPERVTVGIHELLTNAIEHGNLDITYKGKSELILHDKWKSEIERRLNMDEHKHKSVHVHLIQNDTEITLSITDQGEGFDCTNFLEIDPERLFDPHGRGIAVAKSMSFDALSYNDEGNTVIAIVKL